MQTRTFFRENGLFIGVIAALVLAFLLLRTKGDRLGSLTEFDATITAGQPTVVEFYANT